MVIRSAALGAVRASEWNTHVLVRGCAENGVGCINLSTISILITRHGPKHCASSHGIQSCASECWPASGPVGGEKRENGGRGQLAVEKPGEADGPHGTCPCVPHRSHISILYLEKGTAGLPLIDMMRPGAGERVRQHDRAKKLSPGAPPASLPVPRQLRPRPATRAATAPDPISRASAPASSRTQRWR